MNEYQIWYEGKAGHWYECHNHRTRRRKDAIAAAERLFNAGDVRSVKVEKNGETVWMLSVMGEDR